MGNFSTLRRHLMRRYLKGSLLFTASLVSCLLLGQLLPFIAPATAQDSAQTWTSRGVAAYQAGRLTEAQAQWKQALSAAQTETDRLVILENLARVALDLGRPLQAVNDWQQAIATSQRLDDPQTQGRLLIELAQTYSRLGHYRRAIALLCHSSSPAGAIQARSVTTDDPAALKSSCEPRSAVALTAASGNPHHQIAALGSLAEQYRLLGEYDLAVQQFQTAEAILQMHPAPAYGIPLALGRGRLHSSRAQLNYRRAEAAEQLGDRREARQLREQAQEEDAQAIAAWEQGKGQLRERLNGLSMSEADAQEQQVELQLLLHLIPVYERADRPQQRAQAQQQALQQLKQLPNSQLKAFAAIALAHAVTDSKQSLTQPQMQCSSHPNPLQSQQLLQTAVTVAEQIGDLRAKAYALGELGHDAECTGNDSEALALTRQAHQAASQDPLGKDSLYLWDWQLGRIFQRQGRNEEAAIAYQAALTTLNELRGDILTAAPEIRFDFRDTIEPIYRQLAALKLANVPVSEVVDRGARSSQTIRQTLRTVDGLKLSELQNYFGSDCIIAPAQAIVTELEMQDFSTAVINTVILPQRTAVIASFPNGTSQVEWIEQSQLELVETVNRFRLGLEAHTDDEFDPQLAQQLYDWLIRPFVAQLAEVQTLVFVHDGILRSVPMAALHDGEDFLIQRFAVATTPSLELTDPQPLSPNRLKGLALGLTDGVTVDDTRFKPLPFVAQEIEAVTAQLTESKKLLNQAFNRKQLQQELAQERYLIVHMATHGKFGPEPKDNFIVTGDGQKLTISELDQLIRQLVPTGEPIELLALTACETAIGDERATLGLAGVAIRAGARSAIASLWSIDDSATAQVVEDFYQGLLDPALNKAQALQAAQVALLKQGGDLAHPARWAPLILIGNWL